MLDEGLHERFHARGDGSIVQGPLKDALDGSAPAQQQRAEQGEGNRCHPVLADQVDRRLLYGCHLC